MNDSVETVLVINAGSSSLKFQLVSPATAEVAATGIIERVGKEHSTASIRSADQELSIERDVPDHTAGMQVVSDLFAAVGIHLGSAGIRAVGHRVVQGGARFSRPTLIDSWVRQQIHDLGTLAPLHNYANVDGIDGARALLPDVPHVAVFDTAFFTALPDAAATYALNRDVAREYRIRRYGAHGTSHQYVSEQVAELMSERGTDPSTLRQIVLHLGNGASASAIHAGAPVETSMGLTPLEGLVMGTRTGDIDPAVAVHLHRQAGMSPEDVDTLLNKRSGMQGLCGMNDFRDISAAIAAGDERAELAMQVYTHRLRKYIGSYAFTLGGVDAITFTAGIGENSAEVRARTLAGLEGFGIRLAPEANQERSGRARVISAADSAVTVLVVPTNEELAIARSALEFATS